MIKQSHIAFALLMFLEEARSMTYTDKREKKKHGCLETQGWLQMLCFPYFWKIFF